ncbi:MAG TPA: DUF3800 domain-containing protein [Phycisphaerae bacterium]|nr:DUF3800 domain-containing protein [Phycisphaerae bacterium]
MPDSLQTLHRPPRYRLYIDESGDHTYRRLDEFAHKYLALLGAWFEQPGPYSRFADSLENFKLDIFGPRPDKPVILHRSDIINYKGAFGILRDPTIKARFDNDLISLLGAADFHFICVLIDKQKHIQQYADPFHPYHYCLAAMLDRYSGWLNFGNCVGDVMAESRGKEEDIQLKQAYRRVYESGTLIFPREHHQRALTSKDIKLQTKNKNIAGLQLADMLAHPVKQYCLVRKGLLPDPGPVFGKRLLEAVESKFNRNISDNNVDGYGMVIL